MAILIDQVQRQLVLHPDFFVVHRDDRDNRVLGQHRAADTPSGTEDVDLAVAADLGSVTEDESYFHQPALPRRNETHGSNEEDP